MDNKLSPVDISGGTITLSNIGAIGGKFGSPLLNLPEVAIIAMGRIKKVPQITEDGDVYPASIMTVRNLNNLSNKTQKNNILFSYLVTDPSLFSQINIGADHRVLDGATVSKFCNEWKRFIENPDLLVLHMR